MQMSYQMYFIPLATVDIRGVIFSFSGIALTPNIERQLDRVGITDVESSILARTISSYLLQSKSDSTVKKYYSSFLKWKNFCESSGYQPLPAEPIHVVLYLSTLLDSPNDISFHVISSVVYGIKWAHRLNALADPTENSLVVNMLEAAKRLRSKPTVKKDAIPSTLLVQLCNNFQDSSDLIVVRDLAMILLAFSGFLRFNELSALKCKDLSFRSEYMRIRISKSKTDQYRKGDEVLISKGCTSACPYVMLQKYIHIAGLNLQSDNYLFRPAIRSKRSCKLTQKYKHLSYTRTREVIKKKLVTVAPNLNLGLHSLRSGGVTASANSGVNERCLKRHGRWASDKSKDSYVEDSVTERLKISQALCL